MKTLQQIFDHHSQQVKGEAAYGCGHGDKGTVHSYIPEYERLFSPYREKNIKLLEIGVAYGESLEMWYEYFSKGKIYGADIHTNEIGPYLNDERFNINIVDATNPLIKSYFEGDKFDIIIDDGSHRFEDQVKTFNLLRDHMNKGGIYIIEDVANLDSVKNEFLHLKGLSGECEIVDLRNEKNREDDVLIVYKF